MELTRKQMLGQKLVFGFHGTELPADFEALIRKYQIGNVILFLRNVQSMPQLRRLCARIRELILAETGIPPFIIIDQEGGMVSRLPADGVTVPGAMALAATGDPENARRASQITIRQLKSAGANFNMAPVVDINSNADNPVIGVRSFGDDAGRVTRFAMASIEPYAGSGVLCCVKHFPGHGDTSVDSHLGLPRVDKTLEQLRELELVPYEAAIAGGVPAVMISHVLFPNIEQEAVPCTMSRRFVTDLLKKQMGFEGLVLSDCMEMGAIQKYYGTPRGCIAAMKAGIDLVGVSSSFELEQQTAEAVTAAAEAGELDPDELRSSVEKILRFKAGLYTQVCTDEAADAADRSAAADMLRQAVTCIGGRPFAVNENTFFCGCADYRVSGAANDISSTAAFPGYMARAFGARGMVIDKDPGEEEIGRVLEMAASCESIVMGTCNAHLFRGQQALVKALAQLGKPMAAAALRNPYDLRELPETLWQLACYDYSEPALRALEEVLRGGPAPGKCPVRLKGAAL